MRAAAGIAGVANHQATIRFLEQPDGRGSDIAVADPHLFFELSHQAPDLRDRIFYIAEPGIALRQVGTDAVDRGVMDMSRWAPLRVRTLADVMQSGRPFLIYGHPAPNGWAWLVQELVARRVPMSVAGYFDSRFLLTAEPGRRTPE